MLQLIVGIIAALYFQWLLNDAEKYYSKAEKFWKRGEESWDRALAMWDQLKIESTKMDAECKKKCEEYLRQSGWVRVDAKKEAFK